MKKYYLSAFFALLLILLPAVAMPQSRSTKILLMEGGRTKITYPVLCKLGQSDGEISEEIKDLVERGDKHLIISSIFRFMDDIIVTDTSVCMKTKVAKTRMDTTVELVSFSREQIIYTEKSEGSWCTYVRIGALRLGFDDNYGKDEKAINNALHLCDLLFTIQYLMNQKYFDGELVRLKNIKESESGKIQTVNENQRRFVVQANAATNQQSYSEAIYDFTRAVGVNPLSYPTAYYNMALLNAQIELFATAIMDMKKYLLLVPDAADARAAQDKIYEWEAKLPVR